MTPTPDTYARLWRYLERVPELYPSLSWYVRSDELGISFTARTEGLGAGHMISYTQLASFWDPAATVENIFWQLATSIVAAERLSRIA